MLVGAERHPPYQRPPLSKQFLTGTMSAARLPLHLGELDAQWRLGRRAVAVDLERRSVTLDDGEVLRWDGLVVASGAEPIELPGATLAGAHVLRTIEDAVALSDDLQAGGHVVVVGGGFIGSEVASSCRRRGLEVTLVDQLPAPMQAALGPRLAGAMALLHEREGVRLRFGRRVAALTGSDRVSGLLLEGGERLEAQVVVVGLGVRPATGWLQASGLALAGGVPCDAVGRVSGARGVVAVGDVARWWLPSESAALRVEHWSSALAQAPVAARSLLGLPAEPPPGPPFVWSDQHGVKLQLLGLARPTDDTAVVEGSLEDHRGVLAYGRSGRTVAVALLDMPARLAAWQARLRRGEPFPPLPAP